MDPQQRPEAWNYGCVLTTGGPAIVGDEMCKCSLCKLSVVLVSTRSLTRSCCTDMYASGSTGPVKGSLGVHSWDQSMGLAVLRRDGFSYMTAANGTTAVLTTRCAPAPALRNVVCFFMQRVQMEA